MPEKQRPKRNRRVRRNRTGRGLKKVKLVEPGWVSYITYCEYCRKKSYTKESAKYLIRLNHWKGMREYPCPKVPDRWHIGHMPKEVIKGEVTIDEYLRGTPWEH